MTYNACKSCGLIREDATQKLGQVLKEIDRRLYNWKFGDAQSFGGVLPTRSEVEEWRIKLGEVKELI